MHHLLEKIHCYRCLGEEFADFSLQDTFTDKNIGNKNKKKR